jgi:DNA-binding LacI/PurR family transcriptional regulator
MNMVDVGQEAARLIFKALNNRDARQPAEHAVIDMQVKVRSTT